MDTIKKILKPDIGKILLFLLFFLFAIVGTASTWMFTDKIKGTEPFLFDILVKNNPLADIMYFWWAILFFPIGSLLYLEILLLIKNGRLMRKLLLKIILKNCAKDLGGIKNKLDMME